MIDMFIHLITGVVAGLIGGLISGTMVCAWDNLKRESSGTWKTETWKPVAPPVTTPETWTSETKTTTTQEAPAQVNPLITKGRVLTLLDENPDQWWTSHEIAYEIQAPLTSVQGVLTRLRERGLVLASIRNETRAGRKSYEYKAK